MENRCAFLAEERAVPYGRVAITSVPDHISKMLDDGRFHSATGNLRRLFRNSFGELRAASPHYNLRRTAIGKIKCLEQVDMARHDHIDALWEMTNRILQQRVINLRVATFLADPHPLKRRVGYQPRVRRNRPCDFLKVVL